MKLTGGEIIVKQLVREGTPYILGIPGHGVLGLFDAVRKEEEKGGIKYIQVKHEQAATAIADGYFRMSGKPLAVFASIGPGTLNTCIGLATAYVDSTSFLQLCGDTHTNMKGVGVLQEIERYADSNIIRSLEPLAKRSWRAENAAQLPRIMRRAFNMMTTGRKGPCVITLPMDVQAAYANAVFDDTHKEKADALPCADIKQIERALEIMKTAQRPVILAGGGALYARCAEKIEALAEKWGAAIVTTLAGKGAVSEEHPQYCFHTGSKGTPIGIKVCRSADVILALGTRFADETTCSYRKGASFNFPDTKLIHVDIDAHEIGKNYGADIGIIADVNDALDKFNQYAQFKVNNDYLEEIKKLRQDWKNYLEQNRKVKTDRPTISQLIGVLNSALPEDAVIATSSGNTQAQLFQEYCYKKPYCNLTTGGFSTMGWAVPAAMGAKLAKPQNTVVAFLGDGDFMMIMQELSTMAQYNIPVIVVMANNSGWMAIKDLQNDVLGAEAAFGNDFLNDKGEVYSPDFHKIALGFGIDSYNPSTLEEFEKALKEAVNNNRPAMITVDVSREYPYTGGKAFGWWDVPIPAYMSQKRAAYEKALEEETV
ncbi:MAG: thiamine pyrophosphate-binding protein [Christensenellales bacterium]|jgi:acetolactate synthase-1/2/3 large subunit|nr:thiamine pyrophosphate-binding protein [Clostridiales bacterium]